jgi:hypothetical protein
VRVMGQFDINDSIEKIWYTCHLCWCSTPILVNSIVRYLARFWGHTGIHCQKIWFLIMFFCLVGYFAYLKSLSILHFVEICEYSQAASAVLCHSLCTFVEVHDNFMHIYKNLDLKIPSPVPGLLSSGLDPVDLWCGSWRSLVDYVCRTPSYDDSVTTAGNKLRGVLVHFSLWQCFYYEISQTGLLTNNACLLLLYVEAEVSKNLGVQEQGNGQCVVWSGWGPFFQHCLISTSCHCRRNAN